MLMLPSVMRYVTTAATTKYGLIKLVKGPKGQYATKNKGSSEGKGEMQLLSVI